MNLYLTRLILSCFVELCFSSQCFSLQDGLYSKAYEYIYKSKKLADFRNEIRINEGVIIKRIIVSDSVFKNNPYLFLCAILSKKTKSNGNCTQLIGTDRLKVYDSITQEYKGYTYSNNVVLPFKNRSSKKRKAFILSFSSVFKKTITAEVHFQKGKTFTHQSTKSILFYFVFYPNGKIKNVFTAEIQNYHWK